MSRVHLALKYDKLSKSARRSIWKAFLERAERAGQMGKLGKSEFERLEGKEMNGRQVWLPLTDTLALRRCFLYSPKWNTFTLLGAIKADEKPRSKTPSASRTPWPKLPPSPSPTSTSRSPFPLTSSLRPTSRA